MANTNAPMGFQLSSSGGKAPKRKLRTVDANNSNALAPGDAYTIEPDGNVTRAVGGDTVHGIVEGLALQGVDEGPVSRQILPAGVAGSIIGIEDGEAEFEVQVDGSIAVGDVGKFADLSDAAPNATLSQSRQQLDDVFTDGGEFRVQGIVDRPGNAVGANAKVLVRLTNAYAASQSA